MEALPCPAMPGLQNISLVNFIFRVISLAWTVPYFCYFVLLIQQTTLIEPTGAGGGKLNFVLTRFCSLLAFVCSSPSPRLLPSTLLVLTTTETSAEFPTSPSRLEGEFENIFSHQIFQEHLWPGLTSKSFTFGGR